MIHRYHPLGGHFKHAQLIDRAEAVFVGPKQAVFVLVVPFKGEHHVHHMLQHPRAGDRSLLGHMAHQHHRAAVGLGVAHQQGRAFADLADRAGSAGHFRPVHGLDGVDHRVIRLNLIQLFLNRVHGVFGQHQHFAPVRPQSRGPELYLPRALFARDVEHPFARQAQRVAYLQQQRRFSDARLAAKQQQGPVHQSPAQHPVQFADAGGKVSLLSRLDLSEGHGPGARAAALLERLFISRPKAGGCLHFGRAFFQRVPAAAVRALPKPFCRFRPAHRAGIAQFRPCHSFPSFPGRLRPEQIQYTIFKLFFQAKKIFRMRTKSVHDRI